MRLKNGDWVPRILGIVLTLFFLWAMTTGFTPVKRTVERLELLAYDLRFNLALPAYSVDRRIVIVDVDEKSLKAEGQWPWPRNRIARMVDKIFADGATVVAFDVVFPETEPNRAVEVVSRLKERLAEQELAGLWANAALFDNDKILAATLKQHDTVLGYSLQQTSEQHAGLLPQPLILENNASIPLRNADGYVANNAVLQSGEQRAGFFSVEPDPDGVIRRVPIIMRHNNHIYPSLALETLRLYLLADKVTPIVAHQNGASLLEGLRIGDLTIPTDKFGNVTVPYRGKRGSFPYISARDVLRDGKSTTALNGAIVLIGTTATGLYDLRATPVASVYPGVEVHANLISAMLDNHFPVEPSWAEGVNITVLLLLGLLLALLLPGLSSLNMIIFTGVCAIPIAYANIWLWSSKGLIFNLAMPLLLVMTISFLNIVYGFLTESRSRRQLKDMFGQYVPPQLVEEMSQNPDNFGFEGESRELTVLFSDVRGFTTISETLNAVQLKSLLNELFTPMTRIIFENRGTIDKYVGDMIMAFWGAPLKDENHAYHAVVTAMAMIRETERLESEFAARGFPTVRIGIGINTGIMNVGDMGSTYRRAYTVIGDSVNLASRLEGATKEYGVSIIVGEETVKQSGEQLLYRELDLIKVKGKSQAVHIYEPVCLRDEATAELMAELAQSQQAIDLYRRADWHQAEALFTTLLEEGRAPSLYRLYLQRIATLSSEPLPDEWDGVYVRKTK